MKLCVLIRYFFTQLKSTFLHYASATLLTPLILAHFCLINTTNASINFGISVLFVTILIKQ